MNLLFLDQFGSIGGGQRSMLELLPLVRRKGWNATVTVPEPGALGEGVRRLGFDVELVPCGSYTPCSKTMYDLSRFLRRLHPMIRAISAIVAARRIDFLYVNGPRLLPAAAWVARRESIPLLFHCHHRILQPWALRLAGEALRLARGRTIACCRFAGEPLSPYSASYRTIYNGVGEPAWLRRRRDPTQPWNIGVIGRVEPEKGQMAFVEAARILARQNGNIRFVIAGAPLFSSPQYLQRVKDSSRDLPVAFTGWLEDAGRVFSQLDLLVVPSSDIDSTPRVVIEAFSGGVPVVAFPAGGIPELIEDNRTGFLAGGRSPAALATRLRHVLKAGLPLMRSVAAQATAAWQERFTLERYQAEVAAAIEDARPA